MKKYLNAFCSITASILIFVTLSLNWVELAKTLKLSSGAWGGISDIIYYNGWDLIKDNSIVDSHLFNFAALLLIFLAIILLVSATLIILQNLKIIKNDFNFNKVNAGLLTIFAILSVLAFLGSFEELPFMDALYTNEVYYDAHSCSGGMYLLISSVLACVLGWIFSRQPKEKKEATKQNNKTQNVVTEPTYSTQNNINTPNDNLN